MVIEFFKESHFLSRSFLANDRHFWVYYIDFTKIITSNFCTQCMMKHVFRWENFPASFGSWAVFFLQGLAEAIQ